MGLKVLAAGCACACWLAFGASAWAVDNGSPPGGVPGNLLVDFSFEEATTTAWGLEGVGVGAYGTPGLPSSGFAGMRNFGGRALVFSSAAGVARQDVDITPLAGGRAGFGGWFGHRSGRPERGQLRVEFLSADGQVLQTATTYPGRGTEEQIEGDITMVRLTGFVDVVPPDARVARVSAALREASGEDAGGVIADALYLSDQYNPIPPLGPGPFIPPGPGAPPQAPSPDASRRTAAPNIGLMVSWPRATACSSRRVRFTVRRAYTAQVALLRVRVPGLSRTLSVTPRRRSVTVPRTRRSFVARLQVTGSDGRTATRHIRFRACRSSPGG